MLLSFSATLGIVVWSDRLSKGIIGFLERFSFMNSDIVNKSVSYLVYVAVCSVCATVWTLPVLILVFGGFSLVTGRDKRFAKAAALSFELVKRCTVDGAFYGGPMMHDYGEFACVHHAFTHAKSLAFMYINMQEKDFENLEIATKKEKCFFLPKTR